jgi:gluconate kinase
MHKPTVVVISGLPGAGKSTVSEAIATQGSGIWAHMEGDQLYNMIRSGWVHPCDDEDGFFLGLLWEQMKALSAIFANHRISFVIDYCFSWEQMQDILADISRHPLEVRAAFLECSPDTLVLRDELRSPSSIVGHERINYLAKDETLDDIPQQYRIRSDLATPSAISHAILNESRFIYA